MLPKTSVCCSASPPTEKVTPGGSCIVVRTALHVGHDLAGGAALHVRLDVDHPVAIEVVDHRRARCPGSIRATWPSGIVRGAPPVRPARPAAAAAGPRRAAAPPARAAPSTSRVSPLGSTQSPASMPANAGPQRLRHLAHREAERAGERRGRDRPSAPASVPWSTARRPPRPASAPPPSAPARPPALSAARSGPLSCSISCLRPPPKSLVNTASFTPPSCASSARSSRGDLLRAERLRSSFGVSCT